MELDALGEPGVGRERGEVDLAAVQHRVLDAVRLAVTLQEVPDLGGDGGAAQEQGVLDDGVRVHVLDGLQRAPDLWTALGSMETRPLGAWASRRALTPAVRSR
jgi:hypothetical protein